MRRPFKFGPGGDGEKSPRLLNRDGDEKALPSGEQARCRHYAACE
jgi:hypothetical protein